MTVTVIGVGAIGRQVALQLAAIGVDVNWFAVQVFGDEGETRPDLVAMAMQRFQQERGRAIPPGDVIVIGDTTADVDCALTHNCFAFAVATGSTDIEALRNAGAHVAVPDLVDPTPLLQLLD